MAKDPLPTHRGLLVGPQGDEDEGAPPGPVLSGAADLPRLREALHTAREHGLRALQGVALYQIASAHFATGELDEGAAAMEEALHLLGAEGEMSSVVSGLHELGTAYGRGERHLEAAACFERLLFVLQGIGDREGVRSALRLCAASAFHAGAYERAAAHAEALLAHDREDCGARPSPLLVRGLLDLSMALRFCGQGVRAAACLEEAVELLPQVGLHELLPVTLSNLGGLLLELGEVVRAAPVLERALAVCPPEHFARDVILRNLSLACGRLGQQQRALGLMQEALVAARALGAWDRELQVLGKLGEVHADLGRSGEALGFWGQMLELARRRGDRALEGAALYDLSLLRERLGERERAVRLMRQARGLFLEADSPRAERAAAELLRMGEAPM